MGHPALDAALTAADLELTRLGEDAAVTDTRALAGGAERAMCARVRAAVFVWGAAVLEEYLKNALRIVLDEIEAQQLQAVQVRESLLCCALADMFESAGSGATLDRINMRRSLAQRVNETALLNNKFAVPLDSRTPGPDHLSLIWQVFGLPGQPFPSVRHKGNLNDVVQNRNALAHGRADPVVFGRTRTLKDTMRVVEQLGETILHVHMALEAFLQGRGYIR